MIQGAPSTIAEWVDYAYMWEVKDGTFWPYVKNDSGYHMPDRRLTHDDLALVDPRLGPAMQAMLVEGGGSSHIINGSWVRMQLKHWTAPMLLPVQPELKVHGDFYAEAFYEVRYTEGADVVTLQAGAYNVNQYNLPMPDTSISRVAVASEASLIFAKITTADMETLFPGWHARWLVTTALGMTGQDLAAAVCTAPTPMRAIELPELDY